MPQARHRAKREKFFPGREERLTPRSREAKLTAKKTYHSANSDTPPEFGRGRDKRLTEVTTEEMGDNGHGSGSK